MTLDPFSFEDSVSASAASHITGQTGTGKNSLGFVKSHGGGSTLGASSEFERLAGNRLLFDQAIVPANVARPIPTAELVKRLKELHTQLSHLEQGEVDLSTLQTIRKDLVMPSLIQHKDKGVRALTACCLAEVLRLFAPDAPYTESELKDIFEFFVRQIMYIADTEGPYFVHYVSLLESLSTVKSVVLVTDLNAEDLVTKIFKEFFDLVRLDFQKNVYAYMLDILQQLVEECAALNHDIIDAILHQFTKKRRGENIAAHQLAVDLCNNTTDKLQRYICQYFSEAIVSVTKSTEDEEAAFNDFQSAHELILQINASAKGVLMNVIPLLEEELRYDDVEVRTLATDVLGKIMSEPGSMVAVTYTTVWKTWLDRRNDKIVPIRILWLDFCPELFRHHAELAHDLVEAVKQKLLDPDEKVRLAAVRVVGQMDIAAACNAGRSLLMAVAERAKDKKVAVRGEAIRALAGLFKVTYAEMVSEEGTTMTDLFGWIPGAIIEVLYLDESDLKIAVERALHEDIFPPSFDNESRTERLLRILANFNEKQYRGFVSVLDRQYHTIKPMLAFVECCEKWNGGIVDDDDGTPEQRLNQVMQFLSQSFPDQKKAFTHLQKFAKNNENRIYKFLRTVMEDAVDYKTILKNNKEIMKRLEPHAGLPETFAVLLRRISLTLVGKSSIPSLLKAIQVYKKTETASLSSESQVSSTGESVFKKILGQTAEKVLRDTATLFPKVYSTYMREFLDLLGSNEERIVTDALGTIATICKSSVDDLKLTEDDKDTLAQIVQLGSPTDAYRATMILATADSATLERILPQIIISLRPAALDKALVDVQGKLGVQLVSKMQVVAQAARYAFAFLEDHSTSLNNFVVMEVLMKNRTTEDPHSGEEWVDFDKLALEGVMKVWGIKILVNRIRGYPDKEGAKELAVPVYKVLNKILESDGEL
ncbi:hypothetical protein HDU76_007122, partial [Blyttiomyces sp. JEL0837]